MPKNLARQNLPLSAQDTVAACSARLYFQGPNPTKPWEVFLLPHEHSLLTSRGAPGRVGGKGWPPESHSGSSLPPTHFSSAGLSRQKGHLVCVRVSVPDDLTCTRATQQAQTGSTPGGATLGADSEACTCTIPVAWQTGAEKRVLF